MSNYINVKARKRCYSPGLVNMASGSPDDINIVMELSAGVVVRRAAITEPGNLLSAINLGG